MKTIKPDNMSIMFKSFSMEGKDFLSLSACAFFCFDLNGKEDRLLHEQEMWPAIEASLGKDEIFDFGIPKQRGEFLVYGSCFSREPVKGLKAIVNVGGISKSLAVFGNMHWTAFWSTDPEPFTEMPVDYAHAFGGSEFDRNPFGKGCDTDSKGIAAIPNIQDECHLVGCQGDLPDPAGFTAYPMTWPQRMQYMGQVDEEYLIESWPHFPRGTDPEYFNTAPPDQRINGFFTGDENIEIHNMHPQHSFFKSMLPGLRARIFVHLREGNNEVFKEVSSRPETLWLLPDKERGVLLFRGSTEITDEDFDDVFYCFARWENLSDEPKPIDYYYELFQKELNPLPPVEATAEDPTQIDTLQEKLPEVPAAESIRPELMTLMKEVQELEARATAQLKKIGLTPEEALRKYGPKPAADGSASLAEMELMIVQMEQHTAELMKKFNISEKDALRMLEPKPQPVQMSADEVMAGFRKAGIARPDIETQLREVERIGREVERDLDGLKKKADETAKAAEDMKQPAAESLTETPLTAKNLTVEEVLALYGSDKNLKNLDLSGLDFSDTDLSGADFTGAVLEKTIFKNAKLDDTIFDKSRLIGADFTGASLNHARFCTAIVAGACFRKSKMSEADLSDADFTDSDFMKANLTGAVMNGTVFEKCCMKEVIAHKVIARKALFIDADLMDGNFLEADLGEADFSNAILSFANFTKAYAQGMRLFGAKGEQTVFGYALLDGSRADINTTLTDARFTGARISRACWEGAKLSRAQMVETVLDDSDFSKCELKNAIMTFAVAKRTNFSKADLSNANMSAINLFKGSLRKSILTRTDLKYSNLFGVDFYKTRFGKTNLESANTKRTILVVKPEE